MCHDCRCQNDDLIIVEHGMIKLNTAAQKQATNFKIEDTLQVIPNHICSILN
jgi:D-serine deaminase-like pyridoxal phosphate-dependent protein